MSEAKKLAALKAIEANKAAMERQINGWIVSKGLGHYGTDYMKRAVVGAFGWPANPHASDEIVAIEARQRRASGVAPSAHLNVSRTRSASAV